MKNLRIFIMALLMVTTLPYLNAQNNDESLVKTIDKAKNDLIKVLSKSSDQFNFGIELDDVKTAESVEPLSYYEANFEKLLTYEQQKIETLLRPEAKKIVPLVKNNNVVTTVGVSKKEGNYKVIELINHRYHNDLNQLPREIKEQQFKNLKIIYIPNLNTNVYSADGKSYTNYKGRSLKEANDDITLLKELKRDAKIFQDKYGDQLKENKLLN